MVFVLMMAFLAFSGRSWAVEGISVTTLVEGVAHSALHGIDVDNGLGVAVGTAGAILESTDDGAHWAASKATPTDLSLLAVAVKADHAIAVGQLGVVLVREKGTWTKVDAGTDARLLAVDVNSSGRAVAGGQFGTLLKSEDGGKTWSSVAPTWDAIKDPNGVGTSEPHVYSVVVDELGVITVAGEFGMILRSDDGAASWRVIKPIESRSPTLNALSQPSGPGDSSFAVGQSGELLTSSDGGMTWMRCTATTEQSFLGVAASSGGLVVASGMRVMYVSPNAGLSWTRLDQGDFSTDWYQAVRSTSRPNVLLAVGHSGKIVQISR